MRVITFFFCDIIRLLDSRQAVNQVLWPQSVNHQPQSAKHSRTHRPPKSEMTSPIKRITKIWPASVKHIFHYIRDFFDPSNVFESMRPMVIMCSLTGILPCYMVGKRPDRRYTITRWFYVITVTQLMWFIMAMIRSFRTRGLFSYFIEFEEFTRVFEIFQVISSVAAISVTYAFCFAYRYRFVAAVATVHLVDQRLERDFGVRHDHWKSFVWILWNMAASLALFFGYVFSCVWLVRGSSGHEVSLSTFISYFMPHTVLAQIVFKHRIVVRQIQRRWELLNRVVVGAEGRVDNMTATRV